MSEVSTVLTDKEVMIAVHDGDIDRISILYERYHRSLFNFFHKLTFNKQASEDLVQDVFLRLIRFRNTYKVKGAFTPWMFKIAYNGYCDYKKESDLQKRIDGNPDTFTDTDKLDDVVENKEDCTLLKRSLLQLNDEDRELLIMIAYQKMKYREIAGIVNCSTGTVKTRVFRAIKKLRKIYLKISGEVKV